jgi:uncharacterized membrane protein YraQ (UPF0718 family)/copper chaperone CopZ
MEYLVKFLEVTWEIFLEMSPYLLLGFLFAGILNVVVTKKLVTRYLGKKGIWSSVKASILGVPLPLCSCGVIPTGISFRKNGASAGATNSFLISTPQTGVDSILITYSMMNIYWAVLRPIAAFVTGIAGGIITDKMVKEDQLPLVSESTSEEVDKKDSIFKRIFKYAYIDFLGDISRQLILGIIIAVFITLLIPQSLFTDYLNNPLLNMLIILAISVPLYVCATGSVPIAAAFLLAGVTPGAVLVFLMAGPATNAATITVLWRSLGKKATLIYVGTIVIGSMIFGLLIDYSFLKNQFIFDITAPIHSHIHGKDWLAIISSILLIALLLFVELKKIFYKPIKNKPMNNLYTVEGMTCNHCKSSVEKNVQKLEGVTLVVADPSANQVLIEGANLNQAEIESTINELGFVFKGKKES